MRVILFRGLLGNFFSTGMDRLAKKLRAEGHTVTVHSWIGRRAVQRRVIKERKKRKGPYKLAIGGHSLGGNSANYMTRWAFSLGIPVAATFTWDPTEPKRHQGKGIAHNFMSHDLRAEKVPGAVNHNWFKLNHIQVDKEPRIHDFVLEKLRHA